MWLFPKWKNTRKRVGKVELKEKYEKLHDNMNSGKEDVDLENFLRYAKADLESFLRHVKEERNRLKPRKMGS